MGGGREARRRNGKQEEKAAEDMDTKQEAKHENASTELAEKVSSDKEEGDGDNSEKSPVNDAHKVEVENNDVNGMEDPPAETNGDIEKSGTEDMEPEPIAA